MEKRISDTLHAIFDCPAGPEQKGKLRNNFRDVGLDIDKAQRLMEKPYQGSLDRVGDGNLALKGLNAFNQVMNSLLPKKYSVLRLMALRSMKVKDADYLNAVLKNKDAYEHAFSLLQAGYEETLMRYARFIVIKEAVVEICDNVAAEHAFAEKLESAIGADPRADDSLKDCMMRTRLFVYDAHMLTLSALVSVNNGISDLGAIKQALRSLIGPGEVLMKMLHLRNAWRENLDATIKVQATVAKCCQEITPPRGGLIN